MTRGDGTVPEWDVQSRPQLRITTSQPADESLAVFDRAMRAEGMKIVEQRPDGFVASHRDWAALVLEVNLAFKTQVRVDAEGRDVVATVGFNDVGRAGRRRICAALGRAVDQLRAEGRSVTVGAWESQSKEDRKLRGEG